MKGSFKLYSIYNYVTRENVNIGADCVQDAISSLDWQMSDCRVTIVLNPEDLVTHYPPWYN